jgi:hypothetical protein
MVSVRDWGSQDVAPHPGDAAAEMPRNWRGLCPAVECSGLMMMMKRVLFHMSSYLNNFTIKVNER